MASSVNILSGECPADPVTQQEKERCIFWASIDDSSFTDIEDLRDSQHQSWTSLPECPPTKPQLAISTEFDPFQHQEGDCYRSKNTFVPVHGGTLQRPYEFVSVCCYGGNG